MATTLAPSINFTNVSKGLNSLNTGVGNLRKSSDSIKTVTLNRTKIKRESFARDRVLTSMREEAVRRKDQESIIEASGIGGAMRRSASVIADSTKGFLGRILDFASSLLIGWLLFNLPTIMTAIEDMIVRITSLTQLLQDFISNITNTFTNFGNLLSGVYQNVTQFDFTDESKRVQNAMDDLNINLETMRDQFMQGFDLLSKPLGEGPGEEPVPELNTDYTQDAPTTGGGAPPSPAGASAGFARVYETARKVGDQFPEVTAAQWQLESGGGKKLTGKNNPFGQTGDPKTQKGRWLNVPEGGKKYFLDFDSEEEAIRYRLNRWEYKYGNAATPEQAVKNIQLPRGTKIPGTNDVSHGIYATDPEYVSKITRIIKEQGGNPQRQRSSGPAPAITTKATSKSTGGGKIVQYLHGDRSRPGYREDHKDHDHFSFTTRDAAVKAFKALQAAGYKPYEFEGFGRVGGHSDTGGHYGPVGAKPTKSDPSDGAAFDIPYSSYGSGPIGKADFAKSLKAYQIVSAAIGAGGGEITPSSTPAQVSPPKPPGQNVPSVAQDKRGQQIIIADNPQQPQPQQVSAGGGRSQMQMIPIESSLNSLIKNQILLELAYT
jgi:hypothetical protein